MPDNQQQNPQPQPQPVTFRQPIPTYDGEKDVVDWLRGFERWATSVGLDDPQKFKAVESAMMGKAQEWFAYMDRDEAFEDWDGFSTKVQRRFKKKTTPQEFCKSLTDLKQSRDESVKDFVDRVNKVVLMFKEEAATPVATTDPGRRLVKEARDNVFDLLRTSLFTAGLRDGIKTHVLRQALTSWPLIEEAALRVESTEGNTQNKQQAGGRSINAMEEEGNVSAMRGRGGGQRGRGRGRGARGGQRAMQIGRPGWLRDDMLPQGTCYRCGHQGHFGRDCVTKVENFYWAKLAETLAGRQMAALGWVPPTQQPMQEPQGAGQPLALEGPQGAQGPAPQRPRENPFSEQEFSSAFQDF
jgi:hypothetical protein